MKRLFILIAVCMIGMVLPQGMLAETVYSVSDLQITTSPSTKVEGTKVLIHCDNAGGFGAYLRNIASEAELSAIRGAAEIVFEGNFTSDDISALNDKQCCTAKVVDMGDASFYRFYNIEDSKYKYYAVYGDPNNASSVINSSLSDDGITPFEGDVVLFNGDIYRYNGTTWEVSGNPGYPNLDRLKLYMSKDNASPENGTLAMAGGKFYKYDGTDWEEQPMVNDYSQVTFDKWANSVEEIITSKNVSENDLMPQQLCSNCSKLTTLTLGSGSFHELGNNITSITTVNILKDVTSLGDGMFTEKSSITTVTFEEGDKNLTIGEGCFNGCTGITSLALPARLSSMGKQAFANTTGVATLSIPENSRLTTIPEQAFKSCGNATQAEFDITIPRSVTEIQKQAFGDMARLKKVRFTGQAGDQDLIIREEAFAGGDGSEGNSTLSDVYVDINPADRKLICEYHAFGYVPMEGQTAVENLSQLATLHFNENYWDYYAGDWKKGITFDQTALNSFKDGCQTIGTQSGKPEGNIGMIGTNQQIHNNNGKIPGKQPANGWQQFAKTDTGIDIIVPKGKFYRTYSTPSALVKPDWMKIYRVKGFSDGFIEGQSNASSAAEADAATKQAFTEELVITVTGTDNKTYTIIPVNTGVIRVDIREAEAIYYFLELEKTSASNAYNADLEYPWVDSGDKLNYMFPTKGEEVTIGPTEKSGNTITHRIFGLLKTTTSGVVPQFSRAKVGTKLGDHRAYLKLPASVFHWRDEKNGSTQDATGNDVVVDTRANAYSKISLFFDEDFEDLNGGIATAIINSIEEDMYKNDSFYTLQGVKVAKPTTKGVYIHNGKKILIK